MNLVDATKTCFKKYATFTGRATRSEYWYFVLFIVLASFIIGFLQGMLFGAPAEGEMPNTMLSNLFSLIVLLPNLAVAARRLHDVDKSGWWMLIGLTIIGAIPLIYWYCSKGTAGANRFGPDPLLADGATPATTI